MCWGNIGANRVASITLPQTYSNTDYIVLTTNHSYSDRGWFYDNMCLNKTIAGWNCYNIHFTSNNQQQGGFIWVDMNYIAIGY